MIGKTKKGIIGKSVDRVFDFFTKKKPKTIKKKTSDSQYNKKTSPPKVVNKKISSPAKPKKIKNSMAQAQATNVKKIRSSVKKNKKKIIGGGAGAGLGIGMVAANKMFSDDAASVPKKIGGNPGIGNEVKKGPKKSFGNPGVGNEVKGKKKPTKSYAMSDSQRKNQLSSIKKPAKKKSKSNISNSSSYDASFTKKGLEKRGLKAKGYMSDKNYKSATSKEAKTLSGGGRVQPSKIYTGKGNPTWNKKTGSVQIKYPGANIVRTK